MTSIFPVNRTLLEEIRWPCLPSNNPFATSDFGGFEESSQISVGGFYESYFETQTTLALVAFTSNQIKVSAPEPRNGVALLFLSSAILLALKPKRGKKPLLVSRKKLVH